MFATSLLRVNHILPLLSKALHGQLNDIPRLEEALRGKTHSDARGRSGGNDIARQELHEPAHVRDDGGNRKYHVVGAGILQQLAVDGQLQRQILRIGHFIGGYKPWTGWAKGGRGFPLDPLPAHFNLEGAL